MAPAAETGFVTPAKVPANRAAAHKADTALFKSFNCAPPFMMSRYGIADKTAGYKQTEASCTEPVFFHRYGG